MPIVIGGRNGSSKGRVENLVRRSKDRFGGLQIKLGGQSKEEGKGFLCNVCRPILQVHGRPAEDR